MMFPFKPEHILMNEATLTKASCAFAANVGFWSGVITGSGITILGIGMYVVYDALKQQNKEDGKYKTRKRTEEG